MKVFPENDPFSFRYLLLIFNSYKAASYAVTLKPWPDITKTFKGNKK